MELDESVALRLGSSEIMNEKSFSAQALAYENQRYLSAVAGILENSDHALTLMRPESYPLRPHRSLAAKQTKRLSHFRVPWRSRPFTWERLGEGRGSRIYRLTRIYSFSSMTHSRPPEIGRLWWRLWELFPAHMRACRILRGGPYVFWGLAAWGWSLCFIHFHSCY